MARQPAGVRDAAEQHHLAASDAPATATDATAADAAATDATTFARLVAAIRAEIAALDSEDADRIEAASAAKVTALADVQAVVAAGTPPDREQLLLARDLNAEAALRARGKLRSVEKRLANLAGVAGRPMPLVYGRDGRWT